MELTADGGIIEHRPLGDVFVNTRGMRFCARGQDGKSCGKGAECPTGAICEVDESD
jgi:hypothetical protein